MSDRSNAGAAEKIDVDQFFANKDGGSTALEVGIGALLSALLLETSSNSVISEYIIIITGAGLLLIPILRRMALSHPVIETNLRQSTDIFLYLIFTSVLYINISLTTYAVDSLHFLDTADIVWAIPISLVLLVITVVVGYELIVKDMTLYILSVIHNTWCDNRTGGDDSFARSLMSSIISLCLPIVGGHSMSIRNTEANKLLQHTEQSGLYLDKKKSGFDLRSLLKCFLLTLALVFILMGILRVLNQYWIGDILAFILTVLAGMIILGLAQFLLGRFGHAKESMIFKKRHIGFALLATLTVLAIEADYPVIDIVRSTGNLLLGLLFILIAISMILLIYLKLIGDDQTVE